MTFLESLHLLGNARRFGMKLGLEPMQALMVPLGQVHHRLRFIHLAGTNGKGSTAAYCEAGLRHAGFKVGLFTSPHLVSVRERIQVNRKLISEDAFAEGMLAVVEAARLAELEPTFFELITALALWHFAEESVDWVVWETGLGGRLDATNIVFSEVAIITQIALDHEKWLGSTLGEIAREKAGILKPPHEGRPQLLICAEPPGEPPGEARTVIQNRATELGVTTRYACDDAELGLEDLGFRHGKQYVRLEGHETALGLSGPHQTRNAACAWAALRSLGIPPKQIAEGLALTTWPGRFEVLSMDPLIVLDGAHNPAGAEQLVITWCRFLEFRYGFSPKQVLKQARLIFGSVTDKDLARMAETLRPLIAEVSLVNLSSERAANGAKLAELFAGLPMNLYGSVKEVWNELKTQPQPRPVLIAGSLFLAGEILAEHRGNPDEYQMNELLEETGKGNRYGTHAGRRV